MLGSIGLGDARSQEDAAPATEDPELDVEIEIDDLGPPDAAGAAPALPDDRAARDAWLTARIGKILAGRPALARARVGVALVDLANGEVLYTRDEHAKFNLASNAKVITSAAALARLGPEFRWRTAIYGEKWDPLTGTVEGDLYLRGRGDPTLRAEDIKKLVHDLKLAGVRAIKGQLVYDTSYFDGVVEPPHFAEQPKERAGFRAPVGALSIEGNSIVVVVEPDPAGVLPAEVSLDPPAGDYVEVTLADVTTVTTGRTRLRVETKPVKKLGQPKLELEVTGQIRADHGPYWVRRRIDDPIRYAHELVERYLAFEAITLLKKKPKRGIVPLTAHLLAVHESPPLGDVVRTMNKLSNNYIAETVLKTLGAEVVASLGPTPRPATWGDGLAAVHRWLVEEVGLADGSFRFSNGSGLFSSTEVSPAQLARVLVHAWEDFRVGPDLTASLAVMGVDGTLRSRLRTTPARGRVRAKTGTLAAVSTLGGYIAVDTRRPLAFSILINDIPVGARGHARRVQDEIVQACVAYLGGQ